MEALNNQKNFLLQYTYKCQIENNEHPFKWILEFAMKIIPLENWKPQCYKCVLYCWRRGGGCLSIF